MEENKRNQIDDVFQKSESLSMILNKNLSFLLKHGMGILFGIALIGIVSTIFIKIADKLEAPMVLSSDNSFKMVLAQSEGRLVLLKVKDKAKVKKGDLLAKIAQTEQNDDLIGFENQIKELQVDVEQGLFNKAINFQFPNSNNTNLQTEISLLKSAIDELKIALKDNVFAAKRNIIENRLKGLVKMKVNLMEQEKLYQKDYNIALGNFEVQEKLYKSNATSLTEFKQQESILNSKELAYKQVQSQIIMNQNSQNDIKEQLIDIDKQLNVQKIQLQNALINMMSSIQRVKTMHYVYSPVDGEVSFHKPLSENDFIKIGEQLFNVIPEQKQIEGVMRMSQHNLGKLKIGNEVKVKFDGYNYMEYGIVKARVISISETPIENTYMVKIEFPEMLKTNQNKEIVYKNGLTGIATVVLKETRLLYKLTSFASN